MTADLDGPVKPSFEHERASGSSLVWRPEDQYLLRVKNKNIRYASMRSFPTGKAPPPIPAASQSCLRSRIVFEGEGSFNAGRSMVDRVRRCYALFLMVPLTSPAFAPPLPIIPITPSTEAWLAMTEEERSDFVLQVNESLTEIQRAMSEGRPHSRIKSRTMDMLSLHFRTLGRVIYLAEELAVHYPGERAFAPDILAVRDVPDVEDDERMAWVVAEEKRGIDLVLELLHRGHRKKDLVENVERYARLGISEYFVYDRARRELQGYRLGDPAERRTKGSRLVSRRYDRIVPQHGMLFSQVLDLGLALMGGNLQFFAGAAELPTSELLLNRITTMMSHVEKRATEAEQKVTEALAAEQKAKDALEAERQQLLRQLRQTLNTLLRARNLCTPEVEEQVDATSDPQKLQQWLLRSLQASSWNEVLSGPHGVPDR